MRSKKYKTFQYEERDAVQLEDLGTLGEAYTHAAQPWNETDSKKATRNSIHCDII